ncbi:MAG: cyclic nucleotide-binding domain-containing protein [Polyangiaceae bacterium]
MHAELDRATRVKRELFLRALVPGKAPPPVARQLVKMMRELSAPRGAVLYQRGAPAKDAYFVYEGTVDLLAEGEASMPMEKGDVMGMIDCAIQRPRGRTAVARTDVDLLVIDAQDWMDVFEENLGYSRMVMDTLGRMQRPLVLELTPDGGVPARELGPEEALHAGVAAGTVVERLVALRSTMHFEVASVQSLCELAVRGDVLRATAGTRLLQPGEAGDRFFVVIAGLVEVERDDPTVRITHGPGDLVLGNLSLAGALDEFRMSARTDAVLLTFPRSLLDDVIEDHFDLAQSIFRGIAIERDRLMTVRAQRQLASQRPPPLSSHTETTTP